MPYLKDDGDVCKVCFNLLQKYQNDKPLPEKVCINKNDPEYVLLLNIIFLDYGPEKTLIQLLANLIGTEKERRQNRAMYL